MKKYIKQITLLIIGFTITFLFYHYPAPEERMLNIQNYLITVGSIISAFIIAYLSAKIFNIKSNRENRQKEIDKLAERLTAYRQLLYFVMKSNNFWTQYNNIAKFKKKYPDMNYERLRSSGVDEERTKFLLEENDISQNTISVYTAMEAIYGELENELTPPWAYNKIITKKYSIEDLVKYHEPSNQIWYFLKGRFSKHGIGLFNDTGLSSNFTENFRELIAKADIRKKGLDFHREIIADLGTEFYEYVIPKMISLVNENTGIPKGILKTFYSLLSIMSFGVIFPIILQSLDVTAICINTVFTLSFVSLTTLSLINFLFEFYNLINEELHTNNNNNDNQ